MKDFFILMLIFPIGFVCAATFLSSLWLVLSLPFFPMAMVAGSGNLWFLCLYLVLPHFYKFLHDFIFNFIEWAVSKKISGDVACIFSLLLVTGAVNTTIFILLSHLV